jgi:hypothetical protein
MLKNYIDKNDLNEILKEYPLGIRLQFLERLNNWRNSKVIITIDFIKNV